jgi:hypothetical protein
MFRAKWSTGSESKASASVLLLASHAGPASECSSVLMAESICVRGSTSCVAVVPSNGAPRPLPDPPCPSLDDSGDEVGCRAEPRPRPAPLAPKKPRPTVCKGAGVGWFRELLASPPPIEPASASSAAGIVSARRSGNATVCFLPPALTFVISARTFPDCRVPGDCCSRNSASLPRGDCADARRDLGEFELYGEVVADLL